MASDAPDPPEEQGGSISPAKRKKLQTWFQYGSEKREKEDHDYAHTMFSQCYVADPANLVYLDALLENLAKKFEGKKRKKAKVRSNRGPFKKAHAARQWKECIQAGLELLHENPWDIPTLRALAEVAQDLRQADEQFGEIELRFLRAALDSDPKNVDVNRHCAESLARIGQYDQAIACLHRIEELVSSKAEIQKQISQLTIAKTARAAGILDEHPSQQRAVPSKQPGNQQAEKTKVSTTPDRTTAEGLEQAIAQEPANIQNYLDLADLLTKKDDLKNAEATLRRALSASGNDLKVREKLENVQMRRGRVQLAAAEVQAETNPSDDAQQLVEKLKQDLNRLEMAVYQSRVERYPEKTTYHYELAVRLKRAGNFPEAARNFAVALDADGSQATSALQLGECLQQMRKYQEAQTRYLQARKLAKSEDKLEVLKLALYRGGVLAAGLKSWQQARSLLAELISLDPAYRDAASRLDKLKSIGDT